MKNLFNEVSEKVEYLTKDQIIEALFNCFDSRVMAEFLEFLEDEEA